MFVLGKINFVFTGSGMSSIFGKQWVYNLVYNLNFYSTSHKTKIKNVFSTASYSHFSLRYVDLTFWVRP